MNILRKKYIFNFFFKNPKFRKIQFGFQRTNLKFRKVKQNVKYRKKSSIVKNSEQKKLQNFVIISRFWIKFKIKFRTIPKQKLKIRKQLRLPFAPKRRPKTIGKISPKPDELV